MERLRRPELRNLAKLEHEQLVERADQAHAVGNDDHGRQARTQSCDGCDQAQVASFVEVSIGFVEHHRYRYWVSNHA